jgi:hypothetical protein
MNYYILPKNKLNINIFLLLTPEQAKPFISYSLIYYLNNIHENLLKLEAQNKIKNSNSITIEYINKMVNPFEFIHTNVPGTLLSVSKVKPDSSLFFDLMEILQVCNIMDFLSFKNKIHVGNFTHNYASSNYLLNMFREENEDHIVNENYDFDKLIEKYIKHENADAIEKKDLLLFEFKEEEYDNARQYIKNIILSFYIVAKYQTNNGICVMKINNIFYKAIIDIILSLTCLFDKVYLIKPTISNVTKGERYIVCKHFDLELSTTMKILEQLDEKIKPYLKNENENENSLYIHSFLLNDIPYYFLNKIEESNAVIGQQQLESYDQIINIFKNKNKEEKVESLKRNHIQKCIQWCEKNDIPHNKFTDKINIFLNAKRKECEDVNSCINSFI